MAERKLPVLRVLVDSNGDLAAYRSKDTYRHVMSIAETAEQSHESSFCGHRIEYEPAVARCRTCVYFRDYKVRGECTVWQCKEVPYAASLIVPQDGSGFCHLHPDNAKRGENG